MGFGMVLAGKRCRAGRATIGRISVISCGVGPRAALVLLASVPWARFNSGMGMHGVIGQCAMGATVVQAEPCRIMAHFPGWTMPMMAARVAGTSERRPR